MAFDDANADVTRALRANDGQKAAEALQGLARVALALADEIKEHD